MFCCCVIVVVVVVVLVVVWCVCDTGKKSKIKNLKLSKLSVSYYVLIKKNSFLGHFCVTDSLTDSLTHSQTHRRKVVVTELHIAAKNTFIGHFSVTDRLTDSLTDSLTESRSYRAAYRS